MSVASPTTYEFPSASSAEVYAPMGVQLVYVGWDQHTMFCAPFCWPLPPEMPFSDLVNGPMAGAFSAHPEWEQIDWDTVTWLRSGEEFRPDMSASLADNGIGHKEIIRFRTPGLTGLKGSGA